MSWLGDVYKKHVKPKVERAKTYTQKVSSTAKTYTREALSPVSRAGARFAQRHPTAARVVNRAPTTQRLSAGYARATQQKAPTYASTRPVATQVSKYVANRIEAARKYRPTVSQKTISLTGTLQRPPQLVAQQGEFKQTYPYNKTVIAGQKQSPQDVANIWKTAWSVPDRPINKVSLENASQPYVSPSVLKAAGITNQERLEYLRTGIPPSKKAAIQQVQPQTKKSGYWQGTSFKEQRKEVGFWGAVSEREKAWGATYIPSLKKVSKAGERYAEAHPTAAAAIYGGYGKFAEKVQKPFTRNQRSFISGVATGAYGTVRAKPFQVGAEVAIGAASGGVIGGAGKATAWGVRAAEARRLSLVAKGGKTAYVATKAGQVGSAVSKVSRAKIPLTGLTVGGATTGAVLVGVPAVYSAREYAKIKGDTPQQLAQRRGEFIGGGITHAGAFAGGIALERGAISAARYIPEKVPYRLTTKTPTQIIAKGEIVSPKYAVPEPAPYTPPGAIIKEPMTYVGKQKTPYTKEFYARVKKGSETEFMQQTVGKVRQIRTHAGRFYEVSDIKPRSAVASEFKLLDTPVKPTRKSRLPKVRVEKIVKLTPVELKSGVKSPLSIPEHPESMVVDSVLATGTKKRLTAYTHKLPLGRKQKLSSIEASKMDISKAPKMDYKEVDMLKDTPFGEARRAVKAKQEPPTVYINLGSDIRKPFYAGSGAAIKQTYDTEPKLQAITEPKRSKVKTTYAEPFDMNKYRGDPFKYVPHTKGGIMQVSKKTDIPASLKDAYKQEQARIKNRYEPRPKTGTTKLTAKKDKYITFGTNKYDPFGKQDTIQTPTIYEQTKISSKEEPDRYVSPFVKTSSYIQPAPKYVPGGGTPTSDTGVPPPTTWTPPPTDTTIPPPIIRVPPPDIIVPPPYVPFMPEGGAGGGRGGSKKKWQWDIDNPVVGFGEGILKPTKMPKNSMAGGITFGSKPKKRKRK